MKRILGILKENGIEVPEDKQKNLVDALKEKYKAAEEHEKALEKIEKERDSYKQKYEEADETIKKFDGSDIEKLEKDVEEWKQKALGYEQQVADRKFSEMFEKSVADAGFEFHSDLSKRSAIDDAKKFGVELKGENLIGASDFLKSYAESNPKDLLVSAEVQKQEELKNKAPEIHIGSPITPAGNRSALDIGIKPLSKMSITEATELKRKDPQAYEKAKGME